MAQDKKTAYFVDSNIFLRVLIKEDEKSFRDCFDFLKLVQEKKIAARTSDLVLAEISWVLSSYYKFSKPRVVLALQGIVNLEGLTIKSSPNALSAIKLYEKTNVKFIDALIASDNSFQSGLVIVSYDRDFDKLNISRQEPRKIVH